MSKIYLKPSQIQKKLEILVKTGVVPFIKGSPGIGKSAIVRGVAEKFGLKLIDIRASQYEPTDFSGLPTRDVENNKSTYLPFDQLPIKGDKVPEGYNGYLVFLDEINHARQPVIAALYKLILDKKVGNHDLHDKVRIICAGNLDSDKAMTAKMSTAFNSRVLHLQMEADLEDWKVDSRIIAYLTQFPKEFYKFDPDSEHKSFSCARSWDQVNEVIQASKAVYGSVDNADLDLTMLDGLLSAGVANHFIGYVEIFGQIPTIGEVLLDPEKASVPNDNSKAFAMACTTADHTDISNVDIITKYVQRLQPLQQALYARMVTKRTPTLGANRSLLKMLSNTLKDNK